MEYFKKKGQNVQCELWVCEQRAVYQPVCELDSGEVILTHQLTTDHYGYYNTFF